MDKQREQQMIDAADRWLGKAGKILDRLDRMSEDRAEILSGMYSGSVAGTRGMPRASGPGRHVERLRIELEQQEREMADVQRHYDRQMTKMARVIDLLPNSEQRTFARQRYLYGWTTPRIAGTAHCSDRHVRRVLRSVRIAVGKMILQSDGKRGKL